MKNLFPAIVFTPCKKLAKPAIFSRYFQIIFSFIICLTLLPAFALSAEKAADKQETPAKNSPPSVIVTIKPIHAMVAAVMGELGKPELLIEDKVSEHDYQMRPSDMKKLQSADIIFFTSLDLETFLIKAIPSLPDGSLAVELAASDGISRQPMRDSDLGIDEHAHGMYDPHIWLSPENAIAMVKQIKKILSFKDKKNRGIYEMNAKNYINKISKASEKITLSLSPYKNIPFIVFHDAYGYFVKQYGLNQVASVSANPESPLSAEKISEINGVIKRKHIYCVFADPAFSEASIKKILNNPDRVKIAQLDPLGINVTKTDNAYLTILDNLANNLLSCLGNEKL